MSIFFTSDTHFCHDRGFVYNPRGFDNVLDMNEAIVERWNSVVGPDDIVYHLGDVMLNDNVAGMKFLSRLNGHIYLLRGNHDTDTRWKLYDTLDNVTVLGYAEVIKFGKFRFYLSHHPTYTSNLDNDAPLSQHLINLYGHTHQTGNFYNDVPFMYHVGLDSHNCYPVKAEQVIEDIKNEIQVCYQQL